MKAFRVASKLSVLLAVMLLVVGIAVPQVLAQGTTYELVQGWYKGRATYYYDFGANSPALNGGANVADAPIYVLITGFDADGNPMFVEGQHNIVDVVPGDPGYSDLWDVTLVTVPADYAANTFTSADQVRSSGYEMTEPGILVNCPIVPAGSTLVEGGAPLVQGWYKGQEVFYFDFGPNTDATATIYAFVTGFDGAGNPQFVSGQANVIDVIPGDAGYSAFWHVTLVTVPEGYVANSIQSADEVMASGYEMTQTDIVVNCPVLRTDEAAAVGADQPPAVMPDTGGEVAPAAQATGPVPGLIWGIGIAALVLLGTGVTVVLVTRRGR
jgi:hypothetical protein